MDDIGESQSVQPVASSQPAASSVPVGVKIISVLYYIGSVLGVLFGILFLFGAGMISSIPIFGVLGAGLFVVVGLFMIAFGVLGFFIGRGLWHARSWARILVIILAVLGLIGALMGIVGGEFASNIFSLLVNLIIGGYLLFSNRVKAAFA